MTIIPKFCNMDRFDSERTKRFPELAAMLDNYNRVTRYWSVDLPSGEIASLPVPNEWRQEANEYFEKIERHPDWEAWLAFTLD